MDMGNNHFVFVVVSSIYILKHVWFWCGSPYPVLSLIKLDNTIIETFISKSVGTYKVFTGW